MNLDQEEAAIGEKSKIPKYDCSSEYRDPSFDGFKTKLLI